MLSFDFYDMLPLPRTFTEASVFDVANIFIALLIVRKCIDIAGCEMGSKAFNVFNLNNKVSLLSVWVVWWDITKCIYSFYGGLQKVFWSTFWLKL